jgi:MFS transporter, FHS family, Na+ dependent glucose transporter 1
MHESVPGPTSNPDRVEYVPQPNRSAPFYLAGFVGLGLCFAVLGPSLDSFRERTGSSTSAIGLLPTAAGFGYMAGSIGAGFVLQKIRVHTVMALGLVVAAAAIVLQPQASTLAMLIALQIVVSIGGAFMDVGANSAVLWIYKGGPVMNALHLFFGLGATLAPGLINQSLRRTDSLQTGYIIVALVLLTLAAVVYTRPSPTSPHTEHARGFPTGSKNLVRIGMLFYLCAVGIEMGFANWIYDYGAAQGFERDGAASWLGTAFLASFTLGRLISVPLAAVVPPAQTLIGDVVVATLGLVILVIGQGAAATVWIGTVLFALGCASMFPCMLSLSGQFVPATSNVTSAYLVGASIGGMAIPFLIGVLLDRSGAGSMPVVVLVATVGCGLSVVAFVRRSGVRLRAASPSAEPAPTH